MNNKLLTALFLLAAILFAAEQSPKYVFLFVGDGMSTPQRTIAEEYSRTTPHGPLTLNALPIHATTRTNSANAMVTDSAAAATAIATGFKTNNGSLGVTPDGKPVESVAELAHRKNMKVGILTSVTLNHATPAGFYAHRPSRSLYYQISLDLLASNFEFFGGGGLGGNTNKKDDPEYQGDIFVKAPLAGYKVVREKDAFLALTPDTPKVLAPLAPGNLPYAINHDTTIPSLAEILAKAIQCLESPRGFFILCEGGAIDWCGHANDAAANLQEMLALDDAVRVAYDFYQKHPQETLIIVTGDHETGGMTMGFASSGSSFKLNRLLDQKIEAARLDSIIKDKLKENPELSFQDIQPIITENFGFLFQGNPKEDYHVLSQQDISSLEAAFKAKKRIGATASRILAGKAGVSWTTGSHTALPTLTTSIGAGSNKFQGYMENTDIANRLKELLNATQGEH